MQKPISKVTVNALMFSIKLVACGMNDRVAPT